MKPPVREIDVEVVPDRPALNDPFLEFVARLMDSMFAIPGTKIRFGLDPLLGLVPGVGSPLAAVVSLYLMIQAARLRVPRIVLVRMAMHVLINAGLDFIPVGGDFISIFYRSNGYIYELLRKHAGTGAQTRRDWFFVVGLVGGVSLILFVAFAGMALLLLKLITYLGHEAGLH